MLHGCPADLANEQRCINRTSTVTTCMKIGITGGDPAGIGLEVVLRALPPLLSHAEWILYTNAGDFTQNLDRFAPELPWAILKDNTRATPGRLWLQSTGDGLATGWGDVSAQSGQRALIALQAASRDVRSGHIDAIVTAPLSKAAVGNGFSGHTEFLKRDAGVQQVAMSFFTETFKVVLATTHLSVVDAIGSLSQAVYRNLIRLIDAEFRRFAFPRPRIAVAAVNPHAGESGMFGTEDRDVLAPAIGDCAAEGVSVSGPIPADSAYVRAQSGEFDVVLAPYHDQGLIPIKLIAPRSSANVTLGLPYVRTSPDHGTAFDIAGRGLADPGGMLTAMRWVLELGDRLARTNKQ